MAHLIHDPAENINVSPAVAGMGAKDQEEQEVKGGHDA